MPPEPPTTTRRGVMQALAGLPAMNALRSTDDHGGFDVEAVQLTADDVPAPFEETEHADTDCPFLRTLRTSDRAVETAAVTIRSFRRYEAGELVAGIGGLVVAYDEGTPRYRSVSAAARDTLDGFGDELVGTTPSHTTVRADDRAIEWCLTVPEPPWDRPVAYRDVTRFQIVGPAILGAVAYGPRTRDADPRDLAQSSGSLLADRAQAQIS